MSECLVVNAEIAAEVFGDEMVLIDIRSGRYFSLRGAAMDLWHLFQAPIPRAQLVEFFTAHDQNELETVVSTMLDAGLLHTANSSAPGLAVIERRAYTAPSVEIYSDLADLIALDPVHEVDSEKGWPVQPPGPVAL